MPPAAAPAKPYGANMTIYLERTTGTEPGQVEAFDLERVRVGRNPDNDLTFDPEKEPQVGRYHAEIYREGGQHFVKDLQSRNGTFVGGQRVERPTPIADGDVIQFAAGGPRVRFSTRPPGATVAGVVPAQREPSAAEPRPDAPPWRRSVGVLGAAAAVAAVIGTVVGYAWSSWWAFSAGLVGAAAVQSVGLLLWSSWWTPRRQRAEARAAADEAVAGPAATDTMRDLVERWAEGVNGLRRSNLQQRGEDAVYALPWFLLLGERGSGRSATVRAARPLPSSAGARRELGPTRTCDWWFFEKCVVLDVTGRYVSHAHEHVDGAEWRKLLDLLRRTRRRAPIDGVIVTVPADALVGRPSERLQAAAGQVRRRLDEMGRELGIAFPVYLLVTKLDVLAGSVEFFDGLPDTAYEQAMGVMNDDIESRGEGGVFTDRAVRVVSARLDALRRSRLNEIEVATVDASRELFLFAEEFTSLGRPLRTFADTLFRRNPYHATPPLRGVFFTTVAQDRAVISRVGERLGLPRIQAPRQATTRPFFARHLFTQILPEERGLVQRTAQWHERYHTAQLAGILAASALALALLLAFTLSFVRNAQALGRLRTDGCRPAVAASTLGPRLAQLEDCREAIESLAPPSAWARLSLNFGLRHTDEVAMALRDRYLDAAWRDVLGPLEARVDGKLAPGPEAPVYVGALLERIDLLGRCRQERACPGAAAWVAPRYAAMLSRELAVTETSEPVSARLVRTQAAFLQWQRDPATLDRMRGADAERVARWIRMGGLRAEWILASASTGFPAVRVKDFWGAEGTVQVDGAYTARAWKEAIQPLLVGLRAIPADQSETAAVLTRFEADYRHEGLRRWEAFLAAFRDGERLTGGRRAGREFAAWVVAPESPYRRVVDAAAANVSPLVPGPNADAPAWARTLQRHAALRAKLAEVATLSPEEQKASASLAAYNEAVDQLRAEVATPDKAYRSALRGFEEGEPNPGSAHPVPKALWNLRTLRGSLGADQGDDRIFWLLLSRPVELGWRVILDQAGVHLQQQWEAIWPELAAPETPAAQRAGRVIGFVNDKLAGFLERRGDRYAPRTLFNEGMPFTGAFLDYLARARLFSPDASGRSEPPRQIATVP
jgi:type VI secretion system protein ImpL